MKTCTRCHLVKDAFPRNKHAKDGLSPWCKDCHREYLKNRYSKSGRYTRLIFEMRRGAEAYESTRAAIRTILAAPRPITTDHDFLLDLPQALMDDFNLRGRKCPFDRLQAIECGHRDWNGGDTDDDDFHPYTE